MLPRAVRGPLWAVLKRVLLALGILVLSAVIVYLGRDGYQRAEIAKAKHVVISADRDDTAVLTTLTVRRLTRRATVVAAVREAENAVLLRESGATSVVTTSDTAGQLLGVATISPKVSQVVQDLLSYGTGWSCWTGRPTPGTWARSPGRSRNRCWRSSAGRGPCATTMRRSAPSS